MQIIVSLRPTDFRKSGAGVDLPVALGYLAATGQLPERLRELVGSHVVYGELTLNGEIFAPSDIQRALRVAGAPVLTGRLQGPIREGAWFEMAKLNDEVVNAREQKFDWSTVWQKPAAADFELSEPAANDLVLASHMNLNVLIAGPQGTGKTTWAKILHALTPTPEITHIYAREAHFGEMTAQLPWRPLEQPHHSASPQAMIGGGNPVEAGLITRAHGGVLIMDEFLQFHPEVLESLREPVESGHVDIARRGSRERFPAKFQLIGTTNLCPCGKLNPMGLGRSCSYSLIRCRSTLSRMSGPLLDRFDFLSLSHEWTRRGTRVSLSEVRRRIENARAFAAAHPESGYPGPGWMADLEMNHRRRRSMALVARGLANMEESPEVLPRHTQRAFEIVVTPMLKLREIFG
jgi:magnesium chelatase family protein